MKYLHVNNVYQLLKKGEIYRLGYRGSNKGDILYKHHSIKFFESEESFQLKGQIKGCKMDDWSECDFYFYVRFGSICLLSGCDELFILEQGDTWGMIGKIYEVDENTGKVFYKKIDYRNFVKYGDNDLTKFF